MGEMTSVARVHVIEGRPWKDALISVVEPRSPYRPWHAADGIEPGDAIIAVLDTDPLSVLAGVGIVGPDGDVDDAIAAIDRFHLNGLPVRPASDRRGGWPGWVGSLRLAAG